MRTITALLLIISIAWSEDGQYEMPDGSLTIPLPDGVTDAGIRQFEDPQGITSRVMFVPESGTVRGIFSTRIRDEMPKSDAILNRIAARYRQNIKAEDGSSLEHIEKIEIEDRLILMAIVRHIEQGNATRLKDIWLDNDLLIRADVLEARIYAVAEEHLVEFKSMAMPDLALNMGNVDENEMAAQAVRDVMGFASSSSVFSDREKAQINEIEVRDDYIVGVYRDPSVEVSPTAP